MWMGAAGLLGASIDASESEAGDVWFAGYCGEHDLESLKEMGAAKSEIMFPGWISGWATDAEAKKDWNDDSKGQKVLYKTNAKSHKAVVCRHFIQRLNATIESAEEKDGVFHVVLKEVPLPAQTVAEWEKAKNAPAAEAGAMGGEMMEGMKEEEKKEGEGEMAMEMGGE